MSREHYSAIMASFLKSASGQSVREMIMSKWKLSHWRSSLSFRQNICDYEEGNVNNHNEEKKSPLLYCCLVHVNRRSASGRVTACLDKSVRDRNVYLWWKVSPYSLYQEFQKHRQGQQWLYKSVKAFYLFEKHYLRLFQAILKSSLPPFYQRTTALNADRYPLKKGKRMSLLLVRFG